MNPLAAGAAPDSTGRRGTIRYADAGKRRASTLTANPLLAGRDEDEDTRVLATAREELAAMEALAKDLETSNATSAMHIRAEMATLTLAVESASAGAASASLVAEIARVKKGLRLVRLAATAATRDLDAPERERLLGHILKVRARLRRVSRPAGAGASG